MGRGRGPSRPGREGVGGRTGMTTSPLNGDTGGSKKSLRRIPFLSLLRRPPRVLSPLPRLPSQRG